MTHKNELNYCQSSGITTWLCTSGTVKQYCKNWKQAYGSHKQWQLERVGLFSPFSILSVLGWISTSERLITLWRSTEMVSHNEKSQHQTMTKAGSCQILRLSGLFYLLLWWLFSIKIQDKKKLKTFSWYSEYEGGQHNSQVFLHMSVFQHLVSCKTL